MGHLLYAISSFVRRFVAIYEFKLELRSGNTQTGAKFVDDTMTDDIVKTVWLKGRGIDSRADGRAEVL